LASHRPASFQLDSNDQQQRDSLADGDFVVNGNDKSSTNEDEATLRRKKRNSVTSDKLDTFAKPKQHLISNTSSFDSQSTITGGLGSEIALTPHKSDSNTTPTNSKNAKSSCKVVNSSANVAARKVGLDKESLSNSSSSSAEKRKLKQRAVKITTTVMEAAQQRMAEYAKKYDQENRLESDMFIVNDTDLAVFNMGGGRAGSSDEDLSGSGVVEDDYDGDNDERGKNVEESPEFLELGDEEEESYESDDSYAARFTHCLHEVCVYASKSRPSGEEPEMKRRRLAVGGLFRIVVLRNKRHGQSFAFLIRLPTDAHNNASSMCARANELWLSWTM
jgi:hypothetical protein